MGQRWVEMLTGWDPELPSWVKQASAAISEAQFIVWMREEADAPYMFAEYEEV